MDCFVLTSASSGGHLLMFADGHGAGRATPSTLRIPFRVFIPTDSLASSGGAIHPRPCGTSWHGMVTTLSPRFSAISACSGCSLGGSRTPPIIKMIGFFAVSCGLTWTPFGGVHHSCKSQEPGSADENVA